MKKFTVFALLCLVVISCAKQNLTEEQADKWNGYERYLKMGEQMHTLWAGKNLNVGTATYGIDENANFYVTYDCSATEWSIQETHLFAGDKKNLPLNRCAQPRVNRFPYGKFHYPRVETYTYRIPLTLLPPAEEPGFAVAAQCVVYRNAKCDGHEKAAWAEGDFKFTDKGKGWYDVFFFNQVENQYTILYGINCSNDSLKLYHIDITHGTVELTYAEYVGNTAGTYDGAAYDLESGVLYFVKVNENELWVNPLEDEDSSFLAGNLQGQVLSATYHDGLFYYVDAVTNAIHSVAFDESYGIVTDLILDTVPGSVTVNDIAMSPEGDALFIMGSINGSGQELISWDVDGRIFCSTAVTVSENAQIAFGSDGILYGMASPDEPSDSTIIWVIDTYSDSLTVIADEIIYLEDPFADLSGGPIM
jgi:hypothetical protein